MKKFVYSYDHFGKTYYWYSDDVEGDRMVSDIEEARIFSEKQVKNLGLDSCFTIGDEMWCDDINADIKLLSLPIRIEV